MYSNRTKLLVSLALKIPSKNQRLVKFHDFFLFYIPYTLVTKYLNLYLLFRLHEGQNSPKSEFYEDASDNKSDYIFHELQPVESPKQVEISSLNAEFVKIDKSYKTLNQKVTTWLNNLKPAYVENQSNINRHCDCNLHEELSTITKPSSTAASKANKDNVPDVPTSNVYDFHDRVIESGHNGKK